jgi:signal transduction histidine kinase/CheY-like chemotaxis protein
VNAAQPIRAELEVQLQPASGAATDAIRAEAIRTLYAQMRNTSLASMVITAYMIAASWAFTSHLVILGWAAVQIASIAIREGMIHVFHKRERSDAELERWASYYVAHQALVGLTWGATIFLFAHPDQPITVALTLCCLYSIGAGAVPGQSYTPRSLYVLVGVLFTMVAVRLIATGTFGYILLGSASALFGLTMVGFCRVQARILQDGFRIRFENRGLVEALVVEKAEAEEARNQAELASLAKSQFLAAASHDLRQPLYALSLFSASLRELKLDEEGRGVVRRIQDSIGVMESLFDGLLDVSRLEAGVVRAHVAEVSVDALFDRLSQVFYPIAVQRGLDLRFRCDGEWVASDATLLEQVLSNLLANALRNTHRGGVLVAARGRGADIRFEIWDTGIGIAEEDIRRIFDEFVQVGNPQRDRRQGLGLGLAIARRAAALLGSPIGVRSRPGKGSCFSVTQPRASRRAPDQLRSTLLPAWTPSADVSGLPAMVVEDDEDVQAALANLLTRWHVPFEMFATGEAALERIAAGGRFRMLLADYRLAGAMNGLDLVDEVKTRHPAPAPQAVLITGDFDPDLIGSAHERNLPLLHKPLRAAVLRTLLGVPDRPGPEEHRPPPLAPPPSA